MGDEGEEWIKRPNWAGVSSTCRSGTGMGDLPGHLPWLCLFRQVAYAGHCITFLTGS